MAVPNLKDKQVLITGAGAGIGRATALAFAKRGANLVVSDVNPARLAEVQREIDALGVSCYAHATDVSDEKAMHAFARAVHARVGPVDVLVNNAGVGHLGQFLSSHGRCPRLLLLRSENGRGGRRAPARQRRVMAGVAPAPNLSAYAASKFAVMSLSDVLKMELDGTGVGVTTVCPGIVNTEITISQLGASTSASRGQVQRVQAYCNARGCEPAVVAERIVDAVRLGRDIVLVGPFARLLYHMNRVSRELTRRLTLFHCRKRGFN